MRGAVGGEQVGISIKDLATPNNGPSLHTAQQQLTTSWQTYRFPLSAFAHTNLTQVFVVFEMDFAGTGGLQVEFRNLYFFS